MFEKFGCFILSKFFVEKQLKSTIIITIRRMTIFHLVHLNESLSTRFRDFKSFLIFSVEYRNHYVSQAQHPHFWHFSYFFFHFQPLQHKFSIIIVCVFLLEDKHHLGIVQQISHLVDFWHRVVQDCFHGLSRHPYRNALQLQWTVQ